MNIAYHLKTVYRNFISQRPYSFLNLIGLSIGLCISFIALLYVTEETGYDTFHKNSKNIYRVLTKDEMFPRLSAFTNSVEVTKFKDEIPQIMDMTSYEIAHAKIDDQFITTDHYYSENNFYATPNIVDFFSFELIDGDFLSFKNDKKVVVISESFALKYFNTILVVGNKIDLELRGLELRGDKETFTIGAVFKDFPKKSSMHPGLIIPYINNISYKNELRFISPNKRAYTYVLLNKNADVKAITDKLNVVAKKLSTNRQEVDYSLQAISRTHLFSEDINGSYQRASIKKLIYYVVIGLLVLLISLLNYLLLYTAITKRRFKEFAIRKLNGLSKLGLLKLFGFEAIAISVFATAIALFLMKMVIPLFNDFTNSRLAIDFLNNYQFIVCGMLLVMLFSMISGVYLTFYISKHSIVEILNDSHNSKTGINFFLKNGAVTVQICIVAVMLIFVLGFYKQLDFMMNSYKGFKMENLLVINDYSVNIPELREALLQYPIIEAIANGPALLSGSGVSELIFKLDNPSEKKPMSFSYVDNNFIPMYQMKIIKGHNFGEEYHMNEVILNETAVRALGLANPIGERISRGTIIGVMKDFHSSSFHNLVKPLIFTRKDEGEREALFSNCITIKYVEGEREKAIQIVNKLLEDLQLENYFDPNNSETENARFYIEEKKLHKVVLVLTIIAVFITVLGLIGMTLFKTQQMTKEIGIRKVNGATISEIMRMLNKDFIKWVLIAFIIACPIAYYATSKWLENYAYKTNLSWWVFALAGGLTLVIALVTVSWQTYRAATRNPVESLRDE